MAESPPKVKVSQNDLRELRRVFDFLADFAPKHKLRRELKPKQERRAKIATFLANQDSVKIVDETGAELPLAVVTLEDKRLEAECSGLTRRIEEIDAKPDAVKRVHARDLLMALEFLGKPTNKKEVEDMLWEVDEDIDGAVSWVEFELMFCRNIQDKTGLEPCQLFSVVQFLMYDKELTGMVTLDETMHMLYNRYGKDRLEAEMKALFGDSVTSDGNARLSFMNYLSAVKARATAVAATAAL
jgi:calmodulin